MATLLELECGDEGAAWERLGFTVSDGATVRLGPVSVRLDGAGGGLRGWTLGGEGGAASIDGIPTAWAGGGRADGAAGAPVHPNGASGVDHVVCFTDDHARTTAALVRCGGDERRRTGPPAVPVAMAFVRFGDVVVEVAEGGGPTRLWGLVSVVEDLDGLVGDLGPELIGEPRTAVQPGRRIATVARTAGLGCAVAFMTPRVRTRR